MRIAFGLALVSAACALACGGSSKGGVSGSGGAGTAGDSSSGGSAASNSSGGNSNAEAGEPGEAGQGGAPDEPVVTSVAKAHAAEGIVAGGVVAHSTHFTGVFSLGAAPGGNRILTSATAQLRGGVLGASQN
jgi:hypothetical protein